MTPSPPVAKLRIENPRVWLHHRRNLDLQRLVRHPGWPRSLERCRGLGVRSDYGRRFLSA